METLFAATGHCGTLISRVLSDIRNNKQNVQASTRFLRSSRSFHHQVTFHESATLDDGETVQFTHMPADIVKAYIDKFGSDDRSRMFKLDVQFKHSGSEPTGQRVSAAAVGASQHPEAGREGPNDVKAHCGLTRKMQGTMRKMLAVDEEGVYYVVTDAAKAMKSKKHGQQQGDQTQNPNVWENCIDAIMETLTPKAFSHHNGCRERHGLSLSFCYNNEITRTLSS